MKRKPYLGWLVLFFTVASCSYELDMPPPVVSGEHGEFGIASARSYFERNATDLALPEWAGGHPGSRAEEEVVAELAPDWRHAVVTTTEEVSLVEMPILSNTYLFSHVRQFKEGRCILTKGFSTPTRLVVARRKDGQTDMFVVTLVPSVRHNTGWKSMTGFRYLGGGTFTGKVFVSTLEGRFVEASRYVEGRFAGKLRVTTRKRLHEKDIKMEDTSYEAISFTRVTSAPASYTFDEGGVGVAFPVNVLGIRNIILRLVRFVWKRWWYVLVPIVSPVWKKGKLVTAVKIADDAISFLVSVVGIVWIIRVRVLQNVSYVVRCLVLPVRLASGIIAMVIVSMAEAVEETKIRI